MSEADLAGAAAGDEAAFARLAERHRRELHVHCYRMLGSLDDAEDLVQETLLRAWRRRETYAGRASNRAWLYRIATNACLDVLARRPRRVLSTGEAANDPRDDLAGAADLPWLQPYPDRLLEQVADEAAEPDAVAVTRETIELAFLSAIQHLPPRQRGADPARRAGLVGRRDRRPGGDQRAGGQQRPPARPGDHEAAAARAPGRLDPRHRPDRREQALLERYMGLMEDYDVDGLVEVLSKDARIAMPPFPAWYEGREAVAEFHRRHAWAAGDWRAVAVRANGHPACACYLRERPEEPFRAFAIDVLRIEDGRIAEIMAFIAPELYPAFGLPETL